MREREIEKEKGGSIAGAKKAQPKQAIGTSDYAKMTPRERQRFEYNRRKQGANNDTNYYP